MRFIERVLDFLERVIEMIALLLLIGMVIVIGSQIFCRYFLNFTPKWSEDIALIFMVWFSFLGIGIGVKRGIHLSIEFFVNILTERKRKVIYIVNEVLVIIFGYILMTRGAMLTQMAMYSTIPSLGVPTAVLYLVVPISGFFIVAFSFVKLMKELVRSRVEKIEDIKNEDVEMEEVI
ncbi:MAG: TRAP transporter small permease [Cetobacterium sp.]|uniref:TRAP transporter small permease n=1 Tax=Cetobacterium sp. ZWU0022 TaxID=1340502 RepID=UPI0006472EFB|nr:TRAP transporter small permease [Cetobacterium sp. ZWU0022]